MSQSFANRDNRAETRFHPNHERVWWRKADHLGLQNCALIDISQSGIAFETNAASHIPVERGDELSIRYMGRDNQPTHYAVVWEHHQKGRVSIGCTKLSSKASLVKPRMPRHLLLALLRRRDRGMAPGKFQRKAVGFLAAAA
jgi:hypothetical protein